MVSWSYRRVMLPMGLLLCITLKNICSVPTINSFFVCNVKNFRGFHFEQLSSEELYTFLKLGALILSILLLNLHYIFQISFTLIRNLNCLESCSIDRLSNLGLFVDWWSTVLSSINVIYDDKIEGLALNGNLGVGMLS